MNESPETDDDRSIRRLLAESGTGESPELLEGLRRLRSFRALPPPAPTGELAALLADPPAPSRRRPQRHRGLILSFALAGAMAAGTTGVAANNDLRLATESFCADVIGQVLQQDSGEQPLPQQPSAADDEIPVPVDDAAAEPEAGVAAAPEDPDGSAAGEAPGEHEVSADADATSPADASPGEAPLPAPAAPEPADPDGPPEESVRDSGRGGGHAIRARPHHDTGAGDAAPPGHAANPGNSGNTEPPGNPGPGAPGPGAPGPGAPGPGKTGSGPGNSGHAKPAHTSSPGGAGGQHPTR